MVRKTTKLHFIILFSTLFLFLLSWSLESTAWARAGGGSSFGGRGSRSFSTPKMPSSPSPSSPGFGTPGRSPFPSGPSQPSSGFFGRSPFLQGMAGGLAGGLLGSLLFGGTGHAGTMGGFGGSGIGLFDLLILGAIVYFGWKFFMKRRREAFSGAYSSYSEAPSQQPYPDNWSEPMREHRETYGGSNEVEEGLRRFALSDPSFTEDSLKEALQDIFFRIQSAWMNRDLSGADHLLTQEMADYFRREFQASRERGRINVLENIAIRKVEPTEVWQEVGKDYITVLFTANLLDYTIDDSTREVVAGDKLNPIKFQEFWTFCRDIGASQWKLSAINQIDEPRVHYN